jgi:hypothetical protein
VLSACSPCIRESHPVAALPVAPGTLPGFPAGAGRAAARPGEIAVDVVHAQQLGRRDWASVALRITLSVIPGAGGEKFRLGTGLLDGTEARALAQAVTEMVGVAAAAPAEPASVESTDVDYHGGSLRVGVLRLRGADPVAYVQAGDLATLMQRAIWEVPTTLYLPVRDLPALAAALAQAATTIDKLRETR